MDKVGLIAPLRGGVVVGHGSRVPFSNPAKVESWVTDLKVTFPRVSFDPLPFPLQPLASGFWPHACLPPGAKPGAKPDSHEYPQSRRIAQLAEHWALNRKVDGSNHKGCLQA